MRLDRIERGILHVLQSRGRMTNAELARVVETSDSACYRKLKRLEDDGLISGYRAVLDQQMLGLSITAFVQVSITKGDPEAEAAFLQRVGFEEHIIECHAVSGSADFLLKLVARDMAHFSQLCMQGILRYPGVKDIDSHFSLKEVKAVSPLPVSRDVG